MQSKIQQFLAKILLCKIKVIWSIWFVVCFITPNSINMQSKDVESSST